MELQLCSAPSSGCQDAGFHCDWSLLAFKATMKMKMGDRHKNGKMPQSSLSLLRLSHFLEQSLLFSSRLLISRVLKALILTFLLPIFFYQEGKRIFSGLYHFGWYLMIEMILYKKNFLSFYIGKIINAGFFFIFCPYPIILKKTSIIIFKTIMNLLNNPIWWFSTHWNSYNYCSNNYVTVI